MADSVDRVFVHALNTVKKIPKTGAARPPAADRMRLYGLYKQAMEGDVDGVMDRPNAYSGLSVDEIRREQDKWDSWNAQRGLGRTEAKRRYIETLIDTMHTYANTQPAVELVAELEFVWNQIKDNDNNNNNSPSSSESFRKDRDAYGVAGGVAGGVGVPSPRPDEYYDAYDGRPQRDRKAERESQRDRERDREREREREPDNRRMSATASDGGPMKILSPMSEEDEAERVNRMRMIEEELAAEVEEEEEEEDREEEEDYARRIAPFDARGLRRGPARGGARGSGKGTGRGFGRDPGRAAATQPDDKDKDELATQPSQRWSKMMERAMVKLSAEVAALREQILSGREFRSQQQSARRTTWFNWFGWLTWTLFKHLAVDVVLLAAVLLWMRRRKDRRLEDHVRAALTVLREYIRKVLPAR